MVLLQNIQRFRFRALLRLQNPSNCIKNPLLTSSIPSNSSESSFLSSISRRPFSLSAHFTKQFVGKAQKRAEPLSVFFRRAVDPNRRVENSGVEAGDDSENAELKEKLRNLEEQVRSLKKEGCGKERTLKSISEKRDSNVDIGAKRSLSALFGDKKSNKVVLLKPTDFGNEDPAVHKELSPDMEMFTHHLYMEGYLKDASFMRKNRFDVTCFEVSYAREFLKFAAVRFGKDHQEIAKWLSASDLKKIALFGCPSLGQKSVNAAKHLRRFFKIDEHKVCQKCKLKDSCKHANEKIGKDATKLHLASVTRVLIMYAMESNPQQLVVPEEINNSVSRLLKEIVNLSKTTSS